MGFLNGIVGGVRKGLTGGDNRMDLQDYLKLGGMAASAATGNVPGMIALGTSMAGDATGSKELAMLGNAGSLATGGIGAANALSGGAGMADAAAATVDAAQSAADGVGAGMGALDATRGFNAVTGVADGGGSALDSFNAVTGGGDVMSGVPAALQGAAGPEAFNAVTGTGDIMAGVPASLQPGMEAGGTKLGDVIKGLLGGTGEERWQNGTDMAMDGAQAYAQEMQPPEAQPLEWQQTEDIMNYAPTYLTALKDYLAGGGGFGGNQYTAQYGA